MSTAGVSLYTESPPDAALDVAVSHALLLDASRAGVEAARVWTPPPAISFGRLDLLLPTARNGIAAACDAGLHPVRRLAGGRATAIGPGAVCVGWSSVSPELSGMQERYEALAAVIVAALSALGVPARIGELAGEWCPGAWSVLAGEAKVGGLAQRMIRGGAWAEAVIVVRSAPELARALDRVQQALGVPWNARTMRGLDDCQAGLTVARAAAALIDALRARRPVEVVGSLPVPLLERAATLRAAHDLRVDHDLRAQA